MNQPKPLTPSLKIDPKDLDLQPVTKADMLEVRAEMSSMKDILTRIATALEAPGVVEAARQAQEAEAARQTAKDHASGKLGYFSG